MAPRAQRRPVEEQAADAVADDELRQAVATARVAAVAPLFAEMAGGDYETITVQRLEPDDEGFLGRIDLAATEEQIRAKFGGGKFRLQLKSSKGAIKSTKTVMIGGEPIFQSVGARARYRRSLGLPTEDAAEPLPAAAAAAPAGPAMGELLTLFTTFQQMQARADAQRAEDQARRDDARRKDEEARDERRRKDEEESRRRDREHQTQMLQLITQVVGRPAAAAPPESNLLEAFTSGMKTALSMQPPPAARGEPDDDDDGEGGGGGGRGRGPDDPVASAIQGAVRGLVDRFGPGSTSPQQAALPAVPDDDVRIRGPLAHQMTDFVRLAQSAGQDPNAILTKAVTFLKGDLEKKVAAARAPAAAAAAPAATTAPPAAPEATDPAAAGKGIAQAAAEMQRQKRNGVPATA